MEMARSRTVVGLLLLAMSACSGRSPAAPAPALSGSWQGTFESDGPGTITLELTQTGLSVSGSVRLSQNTITDVPGTLTGTLETASLPTSMQFTVTYEYGFGCKGSFSGTLNITDGEIEGPYSGQNCVQPFEGTLHATKRE